MIFKLHILSSYVTLLKKYPVAAIKGNLHHALEIGKSFDAADRKWRLFNTRQRVQQIFHVREN